MVFPWRKRFTALLRTYAFLPSVRGCDLLVCINVL